MCQLKKKANNNHLILFNNLEYNKVIICLFSLINIKVIEYVFINDLFTQNHSFFRHLLLKFRSFQKFDEQLIKFESIIHFYRIRFNVFKNELKDISFLIINFSQFSVVLKFS